MRIRLHPSAFILPPFFSKGRGRAHSPAAPPTFFEGRREKGEGRREKGNCRRSLRPSPFALLALGRPALRRASGGGPPRNIRGLDTSPASLLSFPRRRARRPEGKKGFRDFGISGFRFFESRNPAIPQSRSLLTVCPPRGAITPAARIPGAGEHGCPSRPPAMPRRTRVGPRPPSRPESVGRVSPGVSAGRSSPGCSRHTPCAVIGGRHTACACYVRWTAEGRGQLVSGAQSERPSPRSRWLLPSAVVSWFLLDPAALFAAPRGEGRVDRAGREQ